MSHAQWEQADLNRKCHQVEEWLWPSQEVFGGYLLWSEHCKEELSTKLLTGNGKVQEGSTEWEWRVQIIGCFRRYWIRCHLIWTIFIHVSVCIVVWWFIHVVIFTNAVVMHSMLSKHWPSLILSCWCQGWCNGDWVWCTIKLLTWNTLTITRMTDFIIMNCSINMQDY